jgi:homoaconitase/3-isopropylmalate dehydratase large subunit
MGFTMTEKIFAVHAQSRQARAGDIEILTPDVVLLNDTSGTITVETDNANKRIVKYQDDLAALDDRMSMILARYQKQFAAMDNLVGQTKNTQTGLTSTFAGMMAMYTNK